MKRILSLGLVISALTLSACNKPASPQGSVAPAAPAPVAQNPASPPPANSAPAVDNSKPLAIVDGKPITDAEVTDRVQNRLQKLESQIFDIKRDGLGDLVEEKLLTAEAEKKKISVDQLLKQEVDSKVETPSQKELETNYALLKDRFNNQPLEQVKSVLINQIQSSKRRDLYSKYVDDLRKKSKVEIFMERPRIDVSVDDDPSQGPKDAPIVMIEFSDFQCPFCKRARATVKQVLDTYKGKVHYVFRDFPLSFHKNAPKAAEAANCANEQNKYWPYNETLWENQQAIGIDDLKGYAKKIGLDEKKFSECLDSGKMSAEIQKDIQDGSNAGVSGTPAYFINGVFISGAQPFEKFKEVIDEELARKK
jgi:protein-disulfide isomerase